VSYLERSMPCHAPVASKSGSSRVLVGRGGLEIKPAAVEEDAYAVVGE